MLEISEALWNRLLGHLSAQSAGIRESGAFIVGNIQHGHRLAADFVPYESLQADALNEDFVQLSAASFSRLWALCADGRIEVVADIHSHRLGVQQSPSDRENPMLAVSGHVAIILPRYARLPVEVDELGVHIYAGAHRWRSYYWRDVRSVFRLGRQ